MKRCPHCQEELSDSAIRCRHCRRPLSSSIKKKITLEGAYPPWRMEEIFIVVLCAYFLSFVIDFLLGLFFVIAAPLFEGIRLMAASVDNEESVGYQVYVQFQSLLYDLARIGFIYIIVVRYYKLPFKEGLRLQKPKNIKLFWIPIAAIFMYGYTHLLTMYQPAIPELPMRILVSTTPAAILFILLSISIGPIAEELFWRGFVYPSLNRSRGIYQAVLLTSLGHTLMHVPPRWGAWVTLLGIFIVSIIMTIIRALTKSTLASLTFHWCYNLTIFLAAVIEFFWKEKVAVLFFS